MEVVFADANVLFSASYHAQNQLDWLWRSSSLRICTSPYCVNEARRNFTRAEQVSRLDALLERTEIVADCPAQELPDTLMLPSKDVPVLAAAVKCRADTLVTGDRRHFGPFFGQRIFGVLVESPAMIKARIERAAG